MCNIYVFWLHGTFTVTMQANLLHFSHLRICSVRRDITGFVFFIFFLRMAFWTHKTIFHVISQSCDSFHVHLYEANQQLHVLLLSKVLFSVSA